MQHKTLSRTVAGMLIAVAAIMILTGCGQKKDLNTLSNETFRPWADKVGGTTFSFSEPATVTFTFSNNWDETDAGFQKNFMEGAGQTWVKIVSDSGSGIDKDQAKVVFEDKMGDVIGAYVDGEGLRK